MSAGLVAILGGAAITLASSTPRASTASTATAGGSSGANAETTVGGSIDDVFDLGVGPGFGVGRHGFGQITITSISGSNLSLKTIDGWTRTITVDSGTTYEKAGATIALADLAVGDQIRFRQTREADGTYTIDAIAVVLPHVGGKVTAISGSKITVERRDGSSVTINVTSSTTYRVGDDASAGLADIKVGSYVVAEGTSNSDGSLTAARVLSLPDRPGQFRWHLPGDRPSGDSNGDASDSSIEG